MNNFLTRILAIMMVCVGLVGSVQAMRSRGKENSSPKGATSSPKQAEQKKHDAKDAQDVKKETQQIDTTAQRRAQLLEIFTQASHEELEFQTANMLDALITADDVSIKNVNIVIKMLKNGVFANQKSLWEWFWNIIPQHDLETLGHVVEVLNPYFPSTEECPETLLGILVAAIAHEKILYDDSYDLDSVCQNAGVFYQLIKKLMVLGVKYVPYINNNQYTGLSVQESHNALYKDLKNLSGKCPKLHYVDFIVTIFDEERAQQKELVIINQYLN